jgi:hypothetical protein
VVERSPEKAGVGGSTPSLATIFSITLEASLLVTWSQIGHKIVETDGVSGKSIALGIILFRAKPNRPHRSDLLPYSLAQIILSFVRKQGSRSSFNRVHRLSEMVA